MVDVTKVEAQIDADLTLAQKILPYLSFLFGPQVTAMIAAVINGARAIEASLGVGSTAAAVAAATSHNTPGAPNAPALNG